MKKSHYILLLLFAINSFSIAQNCLPDGITFTSQQQIDDFPSNYPECADIEGSVYIQGSDIINLDSLIQITSIGGYLAFVTDALPNLTGLNNLTNIGGDLAVMNTDALQNLTGLENLTNIGGDLYIIGNEALSNLIGLDNLTSVGGDIYIQENDNLISLTGLNNLVSYGLYFLIENNDALQSLTGLEKFDSIIGDIDILGNRNLTSLTGLENLTFVDGRIKIFDNKALPNLIGLDNLTSVVGYLEIIKNDGLTSLTGLENLTFVDGEISILGNKALPNLTGLDNLTSVVGSLIIIGNNSLTSLTGLENLLTILDYAGSLDIRDNAVLSSLTGLNNLTSIEGGLGITDNPALTSLTALDNLSSLGALLIENNDVLPSLTGLNSVTSVEKGVIIRNNDDLVSLTGLDNLISAGAVQIIGNNSLTSLTGLDNLLTIFFGGLDIRDNAALTSLTGLENLTFVSLYIKIANNPVLPSLAGLDNIVPNRFLFLLQIYNNSSLNECEVQSVCEYLNRGKDAEIHDNMTGCNSVSEVEDACQFSLCTSLINPTKGSTGVNITTDLSWSASEDAIGYKLKIGTVSRGTDIADNIDVGNVTVYDPGDFPCGSRIYVKITPYNDNGNVIGCIQESFKTENVKANAGKDVAICSGTSIQLQATGGTTYIWSPIDGLDNPNIANPIASPTITTTYTVTVSNDGRCPDTDDVKVTKPDEITITVDSTRDVRLNPLGFIAITTNDTGNYIYDWSGPDNFKAKTEDLDSLSDYGCYTLTVTDTVTNCSIDSTICLLDKTSTYDLEFANINVYPDPAKDRFVIDFNNTKPDKAVVTIYDISGKKKMEIKKLSKDRILDIDSSILNAGLYIIRIKTEKYGTKYKKIIISK